MATRTQVETFRRTLRDVETLTARELIARWRTYNLADAARTTQQLLADLPILAETFSAISATFAADWYEDIREGPRYTATTAPPPPPERVDALARWGAGPLWSESPNTELALSKIAGGLHRIVADGARQTVLTNVTRDPAKPRWAREASPTACAFCAMLTTRGPVYSQDSVDFQSHDRCSCVAIPVFGDEYEPPTYVDQWRHAYDRSATAPGDTLSNLRQVLDTN